MSNFLVGSFNYTNDEIVLKGVYVNGVLTEFSPYITLSNTNYEDLENALKTTGITFTLVNETEGDVNTLTITSECSQFSNNLTNVLYGWNEVVDEEFILYFNYTDCDDPVPGNELSGCTITVEDECPDLECDISKQEYCNVDLDCLLKDIDKKLASVINKENSNRKLDLNIPLEESIKTYTKLLSYRNILVGFKNCSTCFKSYKIDDLISLIKNEIYK